MPADKRRFCVNQDTEPETNDPELDFLQRRSLPDSRVYGHT